MVFINYVQSTAGGSSQPDLDMGVCAKGYQKKDHGTDNGTTDTHKHADQSKTQAFQQRLSAIPTAPATGIE